jgi:3-(3-hydroxy-phenyl)propionate hydroxylase
VFKPTEVTRLSQSEDCVTIRVMHHRERREETYSASFLVACDGGSSPIRKSLGLELEDLGFDEPWLVVDAIVPDSISERLPQTQVQYCEADRPCTFVVCTGRHRRWEIMLNEDEYRTGNFPDEMLWPILSRWVKPGEVELWRRAAYRFHGLIARQWRKGCVFLAGDAAHMTPPFMAQGMVQGLRDAHNLAWKLAYVLKGQAIASLLDSYETERKPHVRATTRKAMELGRLICERDPDKARQRDQKLRDEQGGVIRTTFRQQMIPGLTTGLICASQAHAGQLFLQPRISNAQGDVRLDDCVSREFVLFVLAFEFTDDLQLLQAAIGDSPIQMVLVSGDRAEADSTVTSVSSSMLACWMRDQGAPIVLVRPDKYVFGHASTTSTALELLSELKGRLR